MPELTASTKIVLGSVAAAAALITGLLGNVLAANISAFFSGAPAKTGRRPLILWLAFFASASLSVIAGSVATFTPTAPAAPTATAAPTSVAGPKLVVTNLSAGLLAQNTRSLLLVCRDAVELANTSDIPTSVVAVGTELDIDGTILTVSPTEHAGTASGGQVTVMVRPWMSPPDAKSYSRIKGLEGFAGALGQPLPVRAEARSTVTIYIDYALKLATALPKSISAVHVLRFPDIKDIQTAPLKCQ